MITVTLQNALTMEEQTMCKEIIDLGPNGWIWSKY